MKKQTYITPAIKTIQVRPTIMVDPSSLSMKYDRSGVSSQNASQAASRGASNWDDE